MVDDIDQSLRFSTTLSIWNVPLDLAKEFISLAKSNFNNKSWMLLKDLMEKAKKYEEYVESKNQKVEEHEARIIKLEEEMKLILSSMKEPEDGEKEIETFGGGMHE